MLYPDSPTHFHRQGRSFVRIAQCVSVVPFLRHRAMLRAIVPCCICFVSVNNVVLGALSTVLIENLILSSISEAEKKLETVFQASSPLHIARMILPAVSTSSRLIVATTKGAYEAKPNFVMQSFSRWCGAFYEKSEPEVVAMRHNTPPEPQEDSATKKARFTQSGDDFCKFPSADLQDDKIL